MLASLDQGGAQQLVTDLLCTLERDRFEPAVLLLYDRAGTHLEQRLDDHDVPLVALGKRRTGFDPTVLVAMANALRRLRPHVVHTHNYALAYSLPSWLMLRVPAGVHTVHTLAEHESRRRLTPMVHRAAFAAGVRPVFISEAVGESFSALYPRVRGTVIRNGIAIERFDQPEVTRAQWRAQEGIGEGELVVASVARLADVKDPLGVVDAFSDALPQLGEARLLLAGDGPLREAVVSRVAALGLGERVRLLGVRSDVPELLHASDILVLNSRYEGLGLAVMEAMAAGLPVVATDVGGLPELVRPGKTGLLVAPGDRTALAAALIDLAQDDARRRTMGTAARSVAGAYGIETMTERYQAVYEALTAPGDAARRAG